MKYELAIEIAPGDLEEEVERMMKEGWVPIGGVSVWSETRSGENENGNYCKVDTYFAQALTHP